jgi:hypothetical protein
MRKPWKGEEKGLSRAFSQGYCFLTDGGHSETNHRPVKFQTISGMLNFTPASDLNWKMVLGLTSWFSGGRNTLNGLWVLLKTDYTTSSRGWPCTDSDIIRLTLYIILFCYLMRCPKF